MRRNQSQNLSQTSKEIKVRNAKAKEISEKNAMAEECFIMGIAVKSGIQLQLKRKQKLSKDVKKLQKFSIERVLNDEIEMRINERYQQWMNDNNVDENDNYCQRDKDKCKQNVILNVLIDYFEEHGEIIHLKSTRKSEKVVKRERLYSFNGIDEKQIHQIGIELSEYFIDQLPTNPNRNRRETAMIINRIPDEIQLPLNGNYNEVINEIVNEIVIGNEVSVNQQFFVYYDYVNGILCQMIIDSSNNVYQIIPVGEQQNDSFYKF